MQTLESLLPPAVIAATSIFLIREVLEAIRKSRAKTRKLNAYKKILAEELERNLWTWKSLRSAITRLQSYKEHEIGITHKIVVMPSGAQHLETRYEDGSLSSGSNLPNASRSSFERVLLGLAEEDAKLYALASLAYDEISDLGHVRSGLINGVSSEEDIHFDGFLDYALRTLDSAIDPMKNLYRACTGKELEQHKLR